MLIATRGSALARWQAEHVAQLLRTRHSGLDIEMVEVETRGDRTLERPIWELGGEGVFVREVQATVLDGRADIAVHSAKDLPSAPALAAPGLVIAAVPERGDPRDALVGLPLDRIPPGGVVATGSTRRRAQLADLRPDLTFTGLRGNIETRLSRRAGVAAVVVAVAALERLGYLGRAAQILEPEVLVPQVGQGALAIECRADDERTRALVAAIEHRPSRRAVDAERGFLGSLGGGCELPAGAYAADYGAADDGAADDGAGGMRLRAVLATLDGRMVLRAERVVAAAEDPGQGGRLLGEHLLAAGGGRSLLSEAGAVTLPA